MTEVLAIKLATMHQVQHNLASCSVYGHIYTCRCIVAPRHMLTDCQIASTSTYIASNSIKVKIC